jgi:hypothetical protein
MYEIGETAAEIECAICKHCLKSRPQRKGKGYIWGRLINTLITSFNPERFKKLLTR